MTMRRVFWKQFSLRGLFVLMTLACMLLGAWTVYVDPFRRQYRSLTAVQRYPTELTIEPIDGPVWQSWLVKAMVGEDAYVSVSAIEMRGARIDDKAMQHVAGLNRLQSMTMEQTQVTDAGLAALRAMPELRTLSLTYSPITDRGIAHLPTLPALRELKLTGTQITDSAVPEFKKFAALESLFIRWTRITNSGAEQMQRQNPTCAVYHETLAAGG
jgi:hypothetical protein